MLKLLRNRPVLQVVVLLTMAVALFAPTAFAFYRCQMMGTTMSSPCCEDVTDHAGRKGVQLRTPDERCCTRVVVVVERGPSDLAPRAHGRQVLSLPFASAATALVAAMPLSRPSSSTRLLSDSGPPLILRVCSLLI